MDIGKLIFQSLPCIKARENRFRIEVGTKLIRWWKMQLKKLTIIVTALLGILGTLDYLKFNLFGIKMELVILTALFFLLIYSLEQQRRTEMLKRASIKKEILELANWMRAEYDTRPNSVVRELYNELSRVYKTV